MTASFNLYNECYAAPDRVRSLSANPRTLDANEYQRHAYLPHQPVHYPYRHLMQRVNVGESIRCEETHTTSHIGAHF